MEQQLTSLELLRSFPKDSPGIDTPSSLQPNVLVGPTWMDDTAVCILASDARQLERKIAATTSIVLDTCRSYGMTPNLLPGKTAVVAAFRGRYSKKVRATHFGPKSTGTLPIVCEDRTDFVAITGTYLHLGGAFQHDGHSRCDVKRRVGIAHEAFSQLRRLIFHNSSIAWKNRRELFMSLVMSKLLYGIETWTFSDKALFKRFHSAVLRLYKRFYVFDMMPR